MTTALVPWQYPVRWPTLIHIRDDVQRAAQLDWRDRELEDRLGQLAASGGGGGASSLDDLTDVTITSPAPGQVLSWNGSQWVNTTPASGVTDHGLLTGLGDDDHPQYLTNGRGDARYSPSTRTIATTLPLTGGGDLSANRTLGVNTFGSAASGIVPASGGGTTNFLRADGTWAAPPAFAAQPLDWLTDVTITSPATGQVLRYNGSQWVNAALGVADVTGAVPSTRTISTTAPLTGGGDLSANRTLDISVFTSTVKGAVPPSGGGTTAFLRADGSWAVPTAGTPTPQPLDWLTDVTITAVANNNVLQYNSGSGQWVNTLSLAGLTSVEATTHQAPTGTTMVARSSTLVHLQGNGAFGSPTGELVVGASFGGGAPAVGPYCAVQGQNAANGWNTLPLSVNHSAGAGAGGIGIGNTVGGFGFGLLINAAGFHCRNINDTAYVAIAASAFPVNSAGVWKHNQRPLVGATFALAAIDPVVYDDERPTLGYDDRDEMPTHVGFVAEDVDAVLPDVTSGEGPDLAIDPMGLLAVLWQATKELAGRVALIEQGAS